MNKIYGILIFAFLIGCKEKVSNKNVVEIRVEFNQVLADELKKMTKIDQIAASSAFPPSDYSHLSQEKWNKFKDSVYTTHEKRLQEIFKENGFVGFDLVGKKGSSNFWVMIQHSDHNPEFQNEVLEKMKIEVGKKNADPRNYGLLVDRVKLNTGQQQVYGTQLEFNKKFAQAYPKNLADSINVNERRESIGLEPIEIYLNDMSIMHFEMNKKVYIKKGINEPKLYKIK